MQVFAADGCECKVVVKGPLCDITHTEVLPMKQNVTVDAILAKIPGCDVVKTMAGPFIPVKSIDVTKCTLDKSGTESFHDYSIKCVSSTKTPTIAGTPITTSTPSGASTTSTSSGTSTTKAPTAVSSKKSNTNSGDSITLINPIGSTKDNPQGYTDINLLVGKAIKKALGLIGSIAFAVFVIGGFMWLTSAGNSDQIKKGTETMLWAGIGICIIFASYAILGFVITGLGAGNAGPSAPLKGGTPSSGGKTPKAGGGAPAGSLCDQYFAKDNLGCFKETTCDGSGSFSNSAAIKKTFADNFDAISKKTKNVPELKGTYISNLCPGEGVCCIKKAAQKPLCEETFGASGFSCLKNTECDQTPISDPLKTEIDLKLGPLNAQKLTKKPAAISSYSISNLCGTGTSVCCVKKGIVPAKKCVFKTSLNEGCNAFSNTNSYKCGSALSGACEYINTVCLPKKKNTTECQMNSTEKECLAVSMFGNCEWK